MAQLILVKHSNSNHSPDRAAADWQLTAAGIDRCKPLAAHLAVYRPRRIFSSPMPKALQTAKSVAIELDDLDIVENQLLAEHSRLSNAPYETLESFHARMKLLFAQPDERVFGDESANQASERFHRGIEAVLGQAKTGENIVIIAHGTVNTLFTARYNALNSYDLWLRLKMPSMIVLDLPDFRLNKVIEDAGQE